MLEVSPSTLPVGHCPHEVALPVEAYSLALHAMHSEPPLAAPYCPGGHAVHARAPSSGAELPGPQRWHVMLSIENIPGVQASQALRAASGTWPGEHPWQRARPVCWAT